MEKNIETVSFRNEKPSKTNRILEGIFERLNPDIKNKTDKFMP